jgi:enamine deaminase RidA (YjgF/YER057c/UK114 family)
MARTVLRTAELMKPIAHFSHGLRVGDEIHLGATAGTDAQRRLVGAAAGLPDAHAQADRMYRNMKLALELLGGRIEDTARLKTYIVDWRDFAACEEAYRSHFRSPEPMRSCVATWGFPLPFAVVEAELTAMVGRSSSAQYCVAGGEDASQALAALIREVRPADVVKLTITLADLREYPAFEEGFTRIFKPPYPARTITAAPLSAPARRVEIEAVAVAGGGEPVEGRGLYRLPGAASAAVLAGPHLYLSAQPGLDDKGHCLPGVEAQARAAWRRIYAILEAAGMEASDVLRTNNWLTDWRAYQAFNAGYGEFVRPPYPPRATVIGELLEPRALVQIEALAHREGRNATVLESNP